MTRGRRGWRIARRIGFGLLAFVLVALVGGYLYAKPLLLTGTGYAAHNACAVAGIAGRQVGERTDLPPNPLVPYLRTSPNSDGSEVNSTVLGVLARQTASYRSDTGCTIGGTVSDRVTTRVDASRNPLATAPSPAPNPAIDAALATAYGDDSTSMRSTSTTSLSGLCSKLCRTVSWRDQDQGVGKVGGWGADLLLRV